MPTSEDYEMFLLLSGGCSLNSSPKKNWVEENGGLPNYICRIARAIMRNGKSKSQAIAIAVSRVKKWAAGADDVDADTRAKAAKAVAQWTALKAKNRAGNVVKASMSREEETEYLMLTYIPSFNMELVRRAWEKKNRADRYPSGSSTELASAPYSWVREVWSDHIIVEDESDDMPSVYKVPYTVNALSQKITFGEKVPVVMKYVEVDDTLTEDEARLLSDLL